MSKITVYWVVAGIMPDVLAAGIALRRVDKRASVPVGIHGWQDEKSLQVWKPCNAIIRLGCNLVEVVM